jgi:hypothetical protein
MESNNEWLTNVLNWKSCKLKNAIISFWRANNKKYIYEFIERLIIYKDIKTKIWYKHI